MYAKIEGSPQNWTALGHRPLQWGCAWHHRNVPLHTCFAARSNGSRVIK